MKASSASRTNWELPIRMAREPGNELPLGEVSKRGADLTNWLLNTAQYVISHNSHYVKSGDAKTTDENPVTAP